MHPSGLTKLLLHGALERPTEKLTWVLYNESIQKAVSIEKKQQKPSRKIYFFPDGSQGAIF